MSKNILAVLLLILCGCSAQPYIVKSPEDYSGIGRNQIYVVSHGWHTGFILPAKQIQRKIPELQQRFPGVPYLEFGWGDKGFYQAKEITSGLTLRAIFWPTQSVVHAVAVTKNPYVFFPESEIEILCLSDGEFSSLLKFVANSFYRDENGAVMELKNGLYGDSQFYKGVGDYYLMNTCNKWTAKGLKSAGMDIVATFKLTAGSVMGYVKDVNQEVMMASVGKVTKTAYLNSVCH